MFKNCVFVIFTLVSFSVFSQNQSNDIQLITTTIENYFEGYIERDISKLNQAFDTVNGTMKVPFIADDGTENFENKYFKDLMPIWGSREKLSQSVLNNCALKVLNMDVEEGKIATAKISMKVDHTIYIDILSLQKMNGIWKITNKIYITLH